MRQRHHHPRPAFTLIELLIVIAIILILMGLLLPAIMRVWGYVDEVRTSTEIKKLAEACDQFKNEHHMYPPARIILRERMDYQPNFGGNPNSRHSIMEQYSQTCIDTMFNGISNTPYAGPAPGRTIQQDLADGLWHDWNGNGIVDNNPMFLEGEEALVYWLGGMRYGAITDRGPGRGFNRDMTKPTINTTGERKGPYFEFDPKRITNNLDYVKNALPLNGVYGSGGWFPVYLDRYGVPYAYFSARGNSQNNYYHVDSAGVGGPPFTGDNNPLWLTDCARLTDQNPPLGITPNPNPDLNFNTPTTIFVPYFQAQNTDPINTAQVNTTYYMGDKFQIVSAGRDKLFGSGGYYNAADPENSTFAYPPLLTPSAGAKQANSNNFTNFVQAKLIR
jgi:prepilin-type N-terminal cleavage/methylation domain-containing protein